MHNNFYFLKKLSPELNQTLSKAVVSECFSQNKDELIIRFETNDNPFFIKASLQSSFSCLSFPSEFNRARKNSIDLFTKLIGQRLLSTLQFENERSFAFEFSNQFTLLFKMHGNRSNIILLEAGTIVDLFKTQIEADKSIQLSQLNKSIDWTFSAFQKNRANLKALYFTFGKPVWDYLNTLDFNHKNELEQWDLIQSTIKKLNEGRIYICAWDNQIILSLVPFGKILNEFSEAIPAATEFFYTHAKSQSLDQEKTQAIVLLKSSLKNGISYLKKNKNKLQELQHDNHYKLWADLIMANLHQIKPGNASVTLIDFYSQKEISINLKPTLSAQKNAEVFYRKAKNQQIEIDKLNESIQRKQQEVEAMERNIAEIESQSDLKKLRELTTKLYTVKEAKETRPVPYHEFEFKGYKIWVGKNANANDELTLKFSFKEDLWLHAKDVAGSHVLIKYQSGKPFPKDVIERAAELAAYNSKRKTETLCPVTYTSKKYVRKRKGDLPGTVVVDREEVILVEPKQ